MPEVVLTGAAGRIEGRYSQGKSETAPIALILHPHPQGRRPDEPSGRGAALSTCS
jgi:alpha/beta superfamily hydrolase